MTESNLMVLEVELSKCINRSVYMTTQEYNHYCEYWKIPLLEVYIDKLEDAFGNALSEIVIERNFVNVLVRAYPQCILVLKEVLCLLKHGFPDGALARARRIYENMVIAAYLHCHKGDADFPDVIDRYFDDQHLRAYYGRQRLFLSMKQDSKATDCNKAINRIIGKHTSQGKFQEKKKEILSNNYWWAKNRAMSFSKMSECIDDKYAKTLYLRACHSVHAGAMGDVALLGRPQTKEQCLYSGPTFDGASVPLQLAVWSFDNMTSIVFDALGVSSPVSNEDFSVLLETYFNNSAEEMKEISMHD